MILSILHTAHHQVFQHSCVRSSMGYYPHFNLAMRSSRGFASAALDLSALFRLAFASASCQKHLTLPMTVSRRIIMQKAHHHPFPAIRHVHRLAPAPEGRHTTPSAWPLNGKNGGLLSKRALIACRHVVSGSLSSPCRGSSHLSLALLGSLSVAREYLALRDGPRRFRLAFTCRVLLRCRITNFRRWHT